MPAEQLISERSGKDLTQHFSNQESQIPAGVSPLQWEFLQAIGVRAGEQPATEDVFAEFAQKRPRTAEMIIKYYMGEATYADLAKEYDRHSMSVQESILRGIGRLQKMLYDNNTELAQKDKYPLKKIQKGKDNLAVARTEKSRQRRREAGKKGGRPPQVDVYDAKTDLS